MAVASSFLHHNCSLSPATPPYSGLDRSPSKSVNFSHLRRRHITRSADNRSSGDVESRQVLDAFFLGKAVAEAVTERLGTVVGEFLSDVGRWQAEQQRQVRDFQEEVQERARKAKLKAVQYSNYGNINEVPDNGSVHADPKLPSSRAHDTIQD